MPLPAPLTESCVGRLRCPGRPPEPGDLCNLPCQDVFGYRKPHHPGVYQLDNHSSLPQGDRFLVLRVQNLSLRGLSAGPSTPSDTRAFKGLFSGR